MEKPRVQFCWYCSRQLYGRVSHEKRTYYGNDIVLHKTCATIFDRDINEENLTARPKNQDDFDYLRRYE